MSDDETVSTPNTGDSSLDDLLDSVQNHLQVSIEDDDIPVLTEVVQSAPSSGAATIEISEPEAPEAATTTTIDQFETSSLADLDDIDFDQDESPQPTEGQMHTQPGLDPAPESIDPDDFQIVELASDSNEHPQSNQALTDELNDFSVSELADQLEPSSDLDSTANQAIDDNQEPLPTADMLAPEQIDDSPLDDLSTSEPLTAEEDHALSSEISENIVASYNPLDDQNFPESLPAAYSDPIDVTHTPETSPVELNEYDLVESEASEQSWAATIELGPEPVELADVIDVDLDELLAISADPGVDDNDIDDGPTPDPEPDTESFDEVSSEPASFLENLASVAAIQPVVESPIDQDQDQDQDQTQNQSPGFQQGQRLEQIDDLIDQRCQTLATELKLELRSLLDALDSDAD